MTDAPTILDGLRAKRAAIGETRSTTIDVPGYDGDLVARIKWLPYGVVGKIAEKVGKLKDPSTRDLYAAADLIHTTCDELLVRGEGGELRSIGAEGESVSFTSDTLGDLLGFEDPKSARKNVLATIPNDYAILRLATQIGEWLQDTTREVDSEYEGR